MTDLRTWYITTYRDQFFVSPPAWFTLYTWMELFYHLPLSTWAVGALLRDDPRVPVHLLVYAVQTAVTTATCVADYMSWSDVSGAEKVELGKLYAPYLALCKSSCFFFSRRALRVFDLVSWFEMLIDGVCTAVFMGVDMYGRLIAKLGGKAAGSKKRN
jgi:hypothetical protein